MTGSYSEWVAAGRPLVPARPVADVIARMRAAHPQLPISYFADETHYRAIPPQDHTPYSADGWPYPDPEWMVCAVDVMHRPDLGVDCRVLAPYWLAEARAGRFPTLKYLIWQAKLYDVRHGWQTQASSGHYDHAHLSFRTDALHTGLGSWSLLPLTPSKEPRDMDQNERLNFPTGYTDRTIAMVLGDLENLRTRLWFAPGVHPEHATVPTPEVGSLLERLSRAADLIIAGGGVTGDGAGVVQALTAEVRDAVADLGEGGAAQVRADA